MCGLSGEIRFDGGRPDVDAVRRMNDRLAPRGPDGEGVWTRGPVALGHRRLKIIDLSDRGAQPMTDDPGGLVTGVFNGCLYNYRELRQELRRLGHRFVSTSDTEVLIKAYLQWGTTCVDRFYGMFAFALLDHRTGQLVLGRDRLGIKPLYLAAAPGRLRFASSLPALLAAGGVDTSIDPVALHQYLTWHATVAAPRTILAGVTKLPPATVRVVEPDGTHRDHRYWEPSYTRRPEHEGMSADEWRDAVLEALRVAVRRRMVADVPVGVLLSGGLDSSLVVALLAEEGQRDLATFSVGFESAGGEEGDEFHYSRLMAEQFGTDHHELMVPSTEVSGALDAAVAAMAEPMVSHDVIAFHLLSRQVAEHVKVVQSGQGADEVFAGYHWYPRLAVPERERAAEAYAEAYFDRTHADLGRIVQPHMLPGEDVSRRFVDEHMARPGAETALDAALRLDTHVMLVDDPVKRVDNMTMDWGLEARVPFLDHELVELAAACPPELKLAHDGKGVLKEAGRKLLPAEVVDRPKGYFPVPAIKHMAGPVLDRVRDALNAPEARARGIFREEYVAELLAAPDEHRTRRGANGLWQVALLELWLQKHGID
ncbi:N-acetylglutaminylglutamine amidotransferase [Streptomyces somaliensis]|uniref:N-acetylglutaminylglutamine amidotransferase n=1 Tax=Streptomyces somaliensis TaxID=78355 RepID=UPI0020CB9A87|nr:N-acetylglutaminylglutamine amidotransferase [Streptomyces somaliensis]MCP9946907.1 N-acetylglutaminylglutamine amidotransferase [Streptomyces somaliensis]MCP9963544.1 N-acetylglutaminylglutamine amidotransferase [Streptomyces somaliensis]MCP9976117.1 N-acetylglutaminylglutamine amidotransferase [Streptomyces somaliensis]MCP9976189.1 N-acetylglutaminylglutamine amidotransferase [Streptomyces somaliensis]